MRGGQSYSAVMSSDIFRSKMNKKIMVFRLAVWGVMGLCLALFLITRYWPDYQVADGDYGAAGKEGQPIVEAIERYWGETGLWPEYLEDLVPEYLAGAPGPQWYWEPGVSLLKNAGVVDTFVRYDFGSPGGWVQINAAGQEQGLAVARVARGGEAPLALEKVREKRLKELEKRSKREPRVMEHRRMQVSLLLAMKKPAEAGVAIGEAAAMAPDHWWPKLAKESLGESSAAPEPREAFATWVALHPTYTHWFYLAVLEESRGGAVVPALEQMVKCPLETDGEDYFTYSAYAFEAARRAYEAKAYGLVLEIAEQWQKRVAEGGPDEGSYRAWRSAAELALGRQAEALADVRAAQVKNKERRLWAGNLAALEQAIQRGDATFRYDPQHEGFRVFEKE